MPRKVLCPSCGSIIKVGLNLVPPKCRVCKKRLPFTCPRTFTYLVRTFWKPVIIVLAALALFWGIPEFRAYRENQKILRDLSSGFTTGA